MQSPSVEVRRAWKRYGGVPALAGADFQLFAGEVHVLAGPNGAGKSTLVNVIGGGVRPDHGEVLVGGRAVAFASPRDAMSAGIALVSQEGSLVPTLSVAENLVLGGRHARRRFGIDWKRTRDHAAGLLTGLGDTIDVRTRVSALPPDERQIVEIVRAISLDSSCLVLDEPTTFLDAGQTRRLFELLAHLRAEGRSILVVSHRLEEMLRIGDRFTVMRDGRVTASEPAAVVDEAWLVRRMMEGHEAVTATVAPAPSAHRAAIVFSAKNISDTAGRVRDVSFELHAGEIAGLGGPIGSGQSELLETLFGARPRALGTIVVGDTSTGHTPIEAMRAGIGFVPDDRRAKALVGQSSVLENMLLGARAVRPRTPVKLERAEVERWVERLDIKTASIDTRVDRLSGGNQQKIVLARWLILSPRVLLLNEPTRGIDMVAKREIYRLIRQLASDGAAVLFASSEIDELYEMAQRLLVLRDGSLALDLPARDLSIESITAVANGLSPHASDPSGG